MEHRKAWSSSCSSMKLQATMYASPMTSIFSMPYSLPRLSMRRNNLSSMEATLAAGIVELILVKPTTSLKKTETFSRRSSPPHPLQLPRSLVAMLRGKLVRTCCHSTHQSSYSSLRQHDR